MPRPIILWLAVCLGGCSPAAYAAIVSLGADDESHRGGSAHGGCGLQQHPRRDGLHQYNRNALSSYESDISKTIGAGETSGVQCGCPAGFFPCCRGGTCHADPQCENPIADAGAE